MSVEQALSDYRMVDLRGIDWSEIGSNRTASGVQGHARNGAAVLRVPRLCPRYLRDRGQSAAVRL
jgi:hypothetical protein